jgi:hypothetical protein
MFLEKLNIKVDIVQVRNDLATILNLTDWSGNQIGLTHRALPQANLWKDCIGRLDIELMSESNFSELNEQTPSYTKHILHQLANTENIKLGRARFMRLLPNQGLSVHKDNSIRYHLVLETNQHSYIAQGVNQTDFKAVCYHIPSDGHFYKVDTTKEHFVYNGGKTERIHLVICPSG